MSQPRPVTVTPSMLRRLHATAAVEWANVLAPLCRQADITTPARLARFLANTLHETGNFRRLVEDLSYATATRIREVWPSRFPTPADAAPFVRNPEALAERVYGGRLGNVHPGDGWRWRGRGLLQTTGRDNYARLAIATGRRLEDLPDWLLTREGAAESAVRFWAWRGCDQPADAGDDAEVRRRINGGTIGIDAVRHRTSAALAAIAKEFP